MWALSNNNTIFCPCWCFSLPLNSSSSTTHPLWPCMNGLVDVIWFWIYSLTGGWPLPATPNTKPNIITAPRRYNHIIIKNSPRINAHICLNPLHFPTLHYHSALLLPMMHKHIPSTPIPQIQYATPHPPPSFFRPHSRFLGVFSPVRTGLCIAAPTQAPHLLKLAHLPSLPLAIPIFSTHTHAPILFSSTMHNHNNKYYHNDSNNYSYNHHHRWHLPIPMICFPLPLPFLLFQLPSLTSFS